MQVERKTPDMEAILEVFRELGLEDARVRDKFLQLAEPGDWHTWRRRRLEPQDSRDNTENERGVVGGNVILKEQFDESL